MASKTIPYVRLLGDAGRLTGLWGKEDFNIVTDSDYQEMNGELYWGKFRWEYKKTTSHIGKLWINNDEPVVIDIIGPIESLDAFLIIYGELKEQDMSITEKHELAIACCIMIEELA